jgi:phosphatidyl-myo-inositol alpha-mannosyltransferase
MSISKLKSLHTPVLTFYRVRIMKIAIVASYLPRKNTKTGGVSLAIHRLANELSKVPENLVTVFGLYDTKPEGALYKYQSLFPILRWFRHSKLFILYVLPVLLNFVDFNRFDVVHLHGDDWFYFIRKNATVRTLHGSALHEARTAISLKRKLLQYTIYPLEKIAAHLASITIAVGPDSSSIYQTDKLIGNGVDTVLFSPGLKTEFPSLFFIGTWGGRKRGEFLHKIFLEEVLPCIPHAKLYVVSDYWPSHPSIIPIRFPNDIDLANALSKAWVFAYPSTYEGFGIPYIEALSSGTPIVSSDNLGADFVLEKGKYGIISEDKDFGDKLVELLNNPGERQFLGIQGIKYASKFGWQEIVQQHMGSYLEAIQLFSSRSSKELLNSEDLFSDGNREHVVLTRNERSKVKVSPSKK